MDYCDRYNSVLGTQMSHQMGSKLVLSQFVFISSSPCLYPNTLSLLPSETIIVSNHPWQYGTDMLSEKAVAQGRVIMQHLSLLITDMPLVQTQTLIFIRNATLCQNPTHLSSKVSSFGKMYQDNARKYMKTCLNVQIQLKEEKKITTPSLQQPEYVFSTVCCSL